MSLFRFLSNLLLVGLLSVGCNNLVRGSDAVHKYYVHPDVQGRALDAKMSDYLKRHLQRRSESNILDREGVEVCIHVADDFGGDFGFSRLPGGGYDLRAKDERTMVWLVYQFIKMAGREDKGINTEDLPPLLLSGRDTVVTFPFEYRDLYMPTNQNIDMTYLLALNNLEVDWGIWGHNLSRVLGSNGDLSFGYQNMDQELFARGADGVVHQNQFCFSSDKLLDLTEKYIMDQYGDGSKFPYRMTIGPADNDWVCLCRRCETAGNTKNNATPAVVQFVERLAARFPAHTFFIPGYSTTKALPDHHLAHNVGVFLSAIDYPRNWNSQDERSQQFFRELEEWKALTDNVYIWDYVSNFDDYLTPYPILYVMQERFRQYRKRGVKGLFLNGSGYFYSMQQEMYSFLLAHLLINPDADIDRMVKEYYQDAMPNVGQFYASVVMSMEQQARKSGSELPLYGGMEESLRSYLSEKDFREFYSVFLRASAMEMTHRERVLYEKTRQFVSFSFLEMCRIHGLGSGGFAELVGDEWVVKPEVWSAVEDLKIMTPEDDLWILTDNENAAMDHMDRVNEQGVYVADYENEVELWLASGAWNNDLLLRHPLLVRYEGGSEKTTKLTDAVAGISQNYHWGWQVYPQKDLVIELPADVLAGKSGEFTISFLNSERHRMAPPKSVEVWADDRSIGVLRREGLVDYVDEGEKVVFKGAIGFSRPEHVELRFVASHTRNVGIDEIYFQ
jgi:hypothetical protein